MADSTPELIGFAYGEDVQAGSGRSLGYRLLVPEQTTAWGAEVEALARRLQAAPYPDHWPAVDLFCSALLKDGRRLIAVARYGLSDHTPDHRRGGLELIGVVAPGGLGVTTALAIYRWLKARRGSEDLRNLGGAWLLAEVLSGQESPPRPEGMTGPVPVLPVRLWQEGAFLFAAVNPLDPDQHLRLLEVAGTAHWQWLPLIGPDFPVSAYAQRGPLLAWTPHLAEVAVKLDRPLPVAAVPLRPRLAAAWLAAAVVVLGGLLAGNLWYMVRVHQVVSTAPPSAAPAPANEVRQAPLPAPTSDDASRERFARALYQLLEEKGAQRELKEKGIQLERYDGLVRRYADLRVEEKNEQGKLAVAVAAVLAGRGGSAIEESVRRALAGKGFSDRVINAACEHVREQYAEGATR